MCSVLNLSCRDLSLPESMMTLITKGHGLYTEPLKRFSKIVGGRGNLEPGGIGSPVGFPWVPVSMINVLTPRKNCCREY